MMNRRFVPLENGAVKKKKKGSIGHSVIVKNNHLAKSAQVCQKFSRKFKNLKTFFIMNPNFNRMCVITRK